MKVYRLHESDGIPAKYKRGFKMSLEDGTNIVIMKSYSGYQVTWVNSKTNDFGASKFYRSPKGCANYLKKHFNIDLEY